MEGGYHQSRQQQQQQPTNGGQANSTHDMAKIFVGGLSWQTTEEALRYHFEQYGEVMSVEVMRDRNTGDPRGFAFVVFRDDSTVELIMANSPHEINHKVVDVKRAQARGAAPPSIHHGHPPPLPTTHSSMDTLPDLPPPLSRDDQPQGGNEPSQLTPEQLQNKVFIGGLPLHVDRDGLAQFFTQFGPVVDAIVMMDPIQRRSRGFGFVTFENGSGGAQIALSKQPIYIEGKYVEIKLATPKAGDLVGIIGGNVKNATPRFQNQLSQGGLRNASLLGAGGAMTNNVGLNYHSSYGEFAGLAVAYGRNGWKAGYGSKAFGKAGWAVLGWEDGGYAPERTGFSFTMLDHHVKKTADPNVLIQKGSSGKRQNKSLSPPIMMEAKRSRY